MHTEKVMSSLVMAGRDEEENVREMARKCLVILGYMLQPPTWQPFILQRSVKHFKNKNKKLIY